MKMLKLCLMMVLTAAVLSQAAFLEGSSNSLVVVRVGAPAGTDTSAPVYLDAYDVSGATPTLTSTVALPSTGANALTMSSAREHGWQLHLSGNGQYLTVGGYRLDAGTAEANTSTVARVIGRIDKAGNVDTSTALNKYSGAVFRGASTINGTEFWASGDSAGLDGGVQYVSSLGATTSTAIYRAGGTLNENMRDVQIYSSQLYGCSGSSSVAAGGLVKGVYQLGTGISYGGALTYTQVAAQPKNSTTSFVMMDMSGAVAGVDTLYATAGTEMWKWSKLIDGSWTLNGKLTGTGAEFESVTALGNTIFCGTNGGIFKWTDNGYNQSISGALTTAYITAGADSQLGGVAAIPEPATLSLLLVGAISILKNRRK